LDDGRVLVHDFAGCSVEEVLSAVGLTFESQLPKIRETLSRRLHERASKPHDLCAMHMQHSHEMKVIRAPGLAFRYWEALGGRPAEKKAPAVARAPTQITKIRVQTLSHSLRLHESPRTSDADVALITRWTPNLSLNIQVIP
jgi:hypothetical protein